jgi:hypothetical protein
MLGGQRLDIQRLGAKRLKHRAPDGAEQHRPHQAFGREPVIDGAKFTRCHAMADQLFKDRQGNPDDIVEVV